MNTRPVTDDPLGDGSDFGITGEQWGTVTDATQFGDDVAEEMRAYFEAHKRDRWQEGTADNLMLGLFNIAARALRDRASTVTDEPWWMIERDDDVVRPMYFCWLHEPGSKHFLRGQHSWTPDWQRGAKFATKEAAEEHTNGDPLLFVREHSMMTTVTDEGLVERIVGELRHRSIGKPKTEYGRGWDCGLEEAEEVVRAAIASGHTALLREIAGLREALGRAADAMTCRRDDDAHYCPNCDNSLYEARDAARAALSRALAERT